MAGIDPKRTLDQARDRRTGVRSTGQVEQRVTRGERSTPPATGALENVTAITRPGYVQFSTTPGEPTAGYAEGTLSWDATRGTLEARLADGVDAPVGQVLFLPQTNNASGVAISAGQLVMATGATGDQVTIARAVTNGSVAAHLMLGIAAHAIAAGDVDGKIVAQGEVVNVDTSAWTAGTVLYGDPATAGALTSTQPAAPNYRSAVAIVLRQNATTGRLLVRMPGPEGATGATGATGPTGPTGPTGTFSASPTNGLIAQTATTPTFAARTIQAGGSISITNGSGVAGDPTIALASSVTIATALTLAGKTINTVTGVGVVTDSTVKTYTGTSVTTTTTTLATATVTLVNGVVYDVIGWAGAQGSAPSTGFLDLVISVGSAADVTGTRCGTASGERPIFAFDKQAITGTGGTVNVVMKGKTTTGTGTVQSGMVIAVAIPRGPVMS